ncbi:MAG: DUF4469 domain-containing protein [Bacteroidales bacterium]|jgi:hypothetical protein|nr:DUF4469 domain-containing protein [Bacteroidales bacterium]
MKNKLKAWLKPNDLTPNPNDFSAVLSPAGNVDFNGVVDEVMSEGTEYQRDTVVDISRRFMRAGSRLALSGYNVNTGQCYMRAVITGALYGKKWDPARNSVYVAIIQGADLRRECADTEVEILGVKPDLMAITRVVNLVSKQADGTLPRGRNAQVDGSYLKLAGDDPAVGVYLVEASSGAETKLAAEDIVTNDPSKLIIYVPGDLPAGEYRIKVVTQFTGGRLLNAPREAIYDAAYTVV